MKTRTPSHLSLVPLLLLLAALPRCGVEAGNPGDDDETKKTGVVKISFAKVEDLESKSFKLGLTGIELRSGSGDAVVSAALAAVSDQVELFRLSGEDTTVLAASSSEVPVGTYDQIFVSLKDDAPLTIKNDKDEDEIVGFASTEQHAFRVSQSVEVKEGETTDLVVDLDARRSLGHPDDDPSRRIFRPQGVAGTRAHGLDYDGKVDVGNGEGAIFVCAYLYDPLQPKMTFGGVPGGGMPPPPLPPPPPGPELDPRPFFPTAADVVKDDQVECTHAYERTPVLADGIWHLHHLRPGTYDFRTFFGDGSFQEGATGVVLAPPPGPPPPGPPPLLR